MTLVGKIFTMLILLMSVTFLALAITVFATHRNWRDLVLRPASEATADKPEGLKSRIESLTETNRRLRDEIQRSLDRLAVEQAARVYALAALESKQLAVAEQLASRERELQELQSAHGIVTETLKTNQQVLEDITKERDLVRTELIDAIQKRDESFLAAVAIQDKLNAIEGERQKLNERQEDLLAQVTRMKNVLNKNSLDEFTPVEDIAPDVEGVVTAVGGEELIEISIGSDDGLRKGHVLEVFRRNAYLGRIVIQRAEPDRAVGKILRDYRKGIIRKGDRVATRLS